jgi:O-antigen ligase
LTGFFALEKVKISTSFFKTSLPLVIIFTLGFIGMAFERYHLYNIIKDIFHFIKPVLAICIGYCFYKKINNFKLFVKTIIITGFISAILHYIIIIFFIKNIETVSNIREHGTDNFMELIAIFFLAYYKKFQNDQLFQSKIIHKTIFGVLLTSSVLYFSRTMIVMAILTLLTIYGYTIINRKGLRIAALLLIFTLGFYAFLFSINLQRNKKGIDSFLYKVKNAPAEVFKTRINRENHADLWDHWRGYEANRALTLLNDKPIRYFFGCGYGSLVNLKFYAPLSGEPKGMKYISELHNGYVYILYKIGIVGLLLYLLFLFNMYLKIYFNKDFITIFISAIGLSFIFTTLVTVGINNSNESLMFILGALLFFKERQKVNS